MRPSTVLFDLDGTLIDHFAAIQRAHTHTLGQLGLPPPTVAEVLAAVGGGLDETIGRLAGPENVAAAIPIYRTYWAQTMLDDVVLLAGARELLTALRQAGVQTAVLTNKHAPSSRLVCDHLGLTGLLDGVFGATDTPWLKPEPKFTVHALHALGAEAATTLLVGDSPYDWAAARDSGMDFIGVTTGTHTAEQLRAAGAGTILPDLAAVGRELLA